MVLNNRILELIERNKFFNRKYDYCSSDNLELDYYEFRDKFFDVVLDTINSLNKEEIETLNEYEVEEIIENDLILFNCD